MHSQSFNDMRWLHAIKWLNINTDKFNRIHTLELKMKYLRYHLLKKEFALIQHKYRQKMNEAEIKKLLWETMGAYEIILKSPSMTNHADVYSRHSVGLSELDTRTLHEQTKQTIPNNNSLPLNNMPLMQSIISFKGKDSGIEPGFGAIQVEDIYNHVFKKFPDPIARWQFISENQANLDTIYNQFKDFIPNHLIKLSYEDVTLNDIVLPKTTDLSRSHTIQKFHRRSQALGHLAVNSMRLAKIRTIPQINIDAALEVIGNDVARVYGMAVQRQFLYQGEYPDHQLKLMLKAEWIADGHTLKLNPSQYSQRYCVIDILMPTSNLRYLSDDSIENLAEHLPLFTTQGDCDAIGSQGQNKLRVKNILMGIDFGHAYQDNVIDKTSLDFEIMDPTFHNYSIFYDSNRSEIVRGLFKLARLKGNQLNTEILKSYGEDFYQTIQAMEPHADVQIFDDYIRKFKELKIENHDNGFDNKKCCESIIKSIEIVKTNAITARDRYIEKFAFYLSIEKKLVDSVKNIEAIFVGAKQTSLRSEDKTVLLHHLRRISVNNVKTVIQWQYKILPHFDREIIATFQNAQLAQQAFNNLILWLADRTGLQTSPCAPYLDGSQIKIGYATNQVAEIADVFDEKKIISVFHPLDYQHYQHFQAELSLRRQMEQLSLLYHPTQFSLRVVADKYYLTINTADTDLFHLVQDKIKLIKQVTTDNMSDHYRMTFSKESLHSMTEMLLLLPEELTKFKAIKSEWEVFRQCATQLTFASQLKINLKYANTYFLLQYEEMNNHSELNALFHHALGEFENNTTHYVIPFGQLRNLTELLLEIEAQFQQQVSRSAQNHTTQTLQIKSFSSSKLAEKHASISNNNLLFTDKNRGKLTHEQTLLDTLLQEIIMSLERNIISDDTSMITSWYQSSKNFYNASMYNHPYTAVKLKNTLMMFIASNHRHRSESLQLLLTHLTGRQTHINQDLKKSANYVGEIKLLAEAVEFTNKMIVAQNLTASHHSKK